MPDELDDEQTATAGGDISVYGIGSAVLGVLSVAAVVLSFLIWSGHRDEAHEREYRSSVLQAAGGWTDVLVNMDAGSIDDSLSRLRDGTVGKLNADFDATIAPFKQVIEKLQSQTSGQVESVSIESLHHDLPGTTPVAPQPELSSAAARTDTVIVVATSVSKNASGGQPKTVRWNLRLGVSDVDGKLLISRLDRMR